MSHQCHAAGCQASVPPKLMMCKKHWYMLPMLMRSAIWKHYRPGQEDDKRITKEYSEAAQKAIKYLADLEGRSAEEIRVAGLVYKMCEPENRVVKVKVKRK